MLKKLKDVMKCNVMRSSRFRLGLIAKPASVARQKGPLIANRAQAFELKNRVRSKGHMLPVSDDKIKKHEVLC